MKKILTQDCGAFKRYFTEQKDGTVVMTVSRGKTLVVYADWDEVNLIYGI